MQEWVRMILILFSEFQVLQKLLSPDAIPNKIPTMAYSRWDFKLTVISAIRPTSIISPMFLAMFLNAMSNLILFIYSSSWTNLMTFYWSTCFSIALKYWIKISIGSSMLPRFFWLFWMITETFAWEYWLFLSRSELFECRPLRLAEGAAPLGVRRVFDL